MSTKSPTTESTAARIRAWVATVDRAAGPKPVALPYLAAADPVALARIALRIIHEGISADGMGLARLALIIGATAEHEATGGHGGLGWGTEAQVRVGLALIDCVMRATGWFSLASGTRLVLAMQAGAMDAVCHCLGREVPQAEGYRPTIRDLAPPFGTLRTIIDGQGVQLVLRETAGLPSPRSTQHQLIRPRETN